MHIVVHITLTILLFGVVLHGQGAGGGRHGHDESNSYENERYHHGSRGGKHGDGSGRYGYPDHSHESGYHNRGKQRPHKTTDKHSSLSNILYFLLFLLFVVIIGCCICGCCLIYKFRSKAGSNSKFNSVPTKEPDSQQQDPKSVTIPIDEVAVSNLNLFPSGLWLGQYFQYDAWHGPYQFSLSFHSDSSTITGNGSDDIGMFTITGKYSTTTNEIELVKHYQQGTGDVQENLGHSVTIEVTWNPEKQLFAGNWYVDTSTYRDEDLFELKYHDSV